MKKYLFLLWQIGNVIHTHAHALCSKTLSILTVFLWQLAPYWTGKNLRTQLHIMLAITFYTFSDLPAIMCSKKPCKLCKKVTFSAGISQLLALRWYSATDTDRCKDKFIFENGAEFANTSDELVPGHSDWWAVLVMHPFLLLHQWIYDVCYTTQQHSKLDNNLPRNKLNVSNASRQIGK